MHFRRLLIPLAITAILVIPAVSVLAAQAKASLEQVGDHVYCLCGCVTTLNHCPHLPSQCESRAEMTALTLKDIKQGKDESAILQDFTRMYGVKVLAAPPARGFDLAAWILPGFGLVFGLIVVILTVSHLRRKPPSEPPTGPPADPKITAAVEEEMSRIVPLR